MPVTPVMGPCPALQYLRPVVRTPLEMGPYAKDARYAYPSANSVTWPAGRSEVFLSTLKLKRWYSESYDGWSDEPQPATVVLLISSVLNHPPSFSASVMQLLVCKNDEPLLGCQQF